MTDSDIDSLDVSEGVALSDSEMEEEGELLTDLDI